MYTEFDLRQVPITLKSARRKVEEFLSANALRLDDVDYMAAIYQLDGDEMLACGGLKGNLLKCIAVSEQLRDTGMSTRLISHLVNLAYQNGFSSVKVFTKPKNLQIFSSLGFHLLASAPQAILMESSMRNIESYQHYLKQQALPGRNGVIVMNGNPFSKGHRYLIEQASLQVDNLYIIPVREDRSEFSYAERRAMMIAGTKDLQNVRVLDGTEYSISQFTFPTYFLKNLDDAADTHITLDLTLFASYIAPSLNATMRFVGSEPTDLLTRRYNELMHEQLEPKGISVVEYERKTQGDTAVSASLIRNHIKTGSLSDSASLAYPTSVPYVIAHLASRALQQELDTTPKPGLVDRQDSGAHPDMDYALMCRSIKALHPYFVRLAEESFSPHLLSTSKLIEVGLDAEKSMLMATGGVNSHKGALFSMGLAVSAVSHLWAIGHTVTKESLQSVIIRLASSFPVPEGTHGAAVTAQHRVKGALSCAVEGYQDLFASWLPYLQSMDTSDPYALHKLLLFIMTTLDDTNIYHRGGSDSAAWVKEQSSMLLNSFSTYGLEQLGQEFVRRNLSPGGSADMLSLTIFVASVVS